MPELPEVEVLVQHLDQKLRGSSIGDIVVLSPRFLEPTSSAEMRAQLSGASFQGVQRRGKYLLFQLQRSKPSSQATVYAHLGMTGRIFLQASNTPLPKHTRLALHLHPSTDVLIFKDPRGFGGCSLSSQSLEKLGPEPWDEQLSPAHLISKLKKSQQAIKIRLLDQTLVAGVGNIYACESLFASGISPLKPCCELSLSEVARLLKVTRQILNKAVKLGLSLHLDFSGSKESDGLFYFGNATDKKSPATLERFAVYDREGLPCRKCRSAIVRMEQAARSTYYCPRCQR